MPSPQAVLSSSNQGVYGYVGNAVVAYALGWAGDKFVGGTAGTGMFIGGLIGLVLRVAKEQIFASSPLAAQLSMSGLGDADFALGAYVNDPYFLPTVSQGPDQLTTPPQVIPVLPPAPAKSASLQGYDAGAFGGRGGISQDRWRSPWG